MQLLQHGVSKRTFSYVDHLTFWRIVGWLKKRHPKLNTHTVIRRHLPDWQINADGIEFFRVWQVPVTRYRYRGARIPNPWVTRTSEHPHGMNQTESRMLRNGHVRFGGRAGETHQPQG